MCSLYRQDERHIWTSLHSGIRSIFLSWQGTILFHFHLADYPRSLDSIAHLYNVGGVNISIVTK